MRSAGKNSELTKLSPVACSVKQACQHLRLNVHSSRGVASFEIVAINQGALTPNCSKHPERSWTWLHDWIRYSPR